MGDGRELTYEMLFQLSRRINSEGDLRTLATSGLRVEEHVIDKHLHDNRSEINEAALKVLKEWMKGCESLTVAYNDLCAALRSVRMAMYITEVLQ